jgi:DNA-binding beta-propeller fold protein YncE
MARQSPNRAAVIVVFTLVLAVGLVRTLPRRLWGGPHGDRVVAAASTASVPPIRLTEVGPHLVSNQTSTPLSIYGEGLREGQQLLLRGPVEIELPLRVLDPRHGYVRLPPLGLPPAKSEAAVALSLRGPDGVMLPGQAQLTVVNDQQFVDPIALLASRDGKQVFALSRSSDDLAIVDVATGAVTHRTVGDRPIALAEARDPGGTDRLLVLHEYEPTLWVLPLLRPDDVPVKLAIPPMATGLALDESRGWALIAEHARDRVVAIDLWHGGTTVWTTDVAPNPQRLAILGEVVAVGSLQTGEVELLDLRTGTMLATLAPTAGTPIIGGHTEEYSQWIIGGSAVRDLAASPRQKRWFLASTGPNIGPNPNRMEVAQNGGIAVIDPSSRSFLWHRGFGAGVPQGMVLDDRAGLLYAADLGVGLLRVVDARMLAKSARASAKALLQDLPIPPPEGFPSIRPASDLGVKGRAGVELHSGPQAVALAPDGKRLYVLNRFSGTLATVDVSESRAGKARLLSQQPLWDMLAQRERRLGQVLYFTDVGKTGMSCDTCHLDGHTGGLLFSKTHPMRLYRSPTVLGTRDTPPYFIPASEQTLEGTARFVGSRNRYHNPPMSETETSDLALFASELTTPPNPFVDADGAPPESLALIDGPIGHPRAGREVFEGRAGCTACHPSPLFTTDQYPTTRGRYLEVGTPVFFPFRVELQDPHPPAFPPPALVGGWDIFPMLTTGTAGLGIANGQLVTATRFPLRAVLETRGKEPHGEVDALTASEKNDLLAYLMTL